MKPFWHAQSLKLLLLKPFSTKLRILMRNEGPELRISHQAVAVNRAENAPRGEKFSLKDYSAVEMEQCQSFHKWPDHLEPSRCFSSHCVIEKEKPPALWTISAAVLRPLWEHQSKAPPLLEPLFPGSLFNSCIHQPLFPSKAHTDGCWMYWFNSILQEKDQS